MSSWTGCTSISDANTWNCSTNMSFETALGRVLRPPQAAQVRPVKRFDQGQGAVRLGRGRIGPLAGRFDVRVQPHQGVQEIARLLGVKLPARRQAAGLSGAAPGGSTGRLRADERKTDSAAHAAKRFHGLVPFASDLLLPAAHRLSTASWTCRAYGRICAPSTARSDGPRLTP